MLTQYYTESSLDGFIADSSHSLDWLLQFDVSGDHSFREFLDTVGAIAMGARTYEWILDHPEAQDPASPWPYTQPVWVFSNKDLPLVEGADIRFVRGDVRPVYEEMKTSAGEKNLWIVGGGDLAGQFHDQGLLDEIIVSVASVTLGAGFPLFPRQLTTPPLRLKSVKAFEDSFAVLHYEIPKSSASR